MGIRGKGHGAAARTRWLCGEGIEYVHRVVAMFLSTTSLVCLRPVRGRPTSAVKEPWGALKVP
jgi:hypothetical protein